MQKKYNSENVSDQAKVEMNRHEDASIQTSNLFPYEHLLLGMLDQNGQNISQESSDSRLSPISMLDRYIEACTRVNSFPSNNSKTSKQICVQYVITDISGECNKHFFSRNKRC